MKALNDGKAQEKCDSLICEQPLLCLFALVQFRWIKLSISQHWISPHDILQSDIPIY